MKKFTPLAIVMGLLLLLATPSLSAQTVGRTNVISSVTLSWNQSADPSVNGYNIYWGVTSGSYSNSVHIAGVSTTLTTLTPMVRGTKYFIAATCTATNGLESVYSAEITWTSPNLPAPPTITVIGGN